MAIKLFPGNSFTLPAPNLGTYRWVDVHDPDAWTDWADASPNYIEQLQIVNEEITWKRLSIEEMLVISSAWLTEHKRRRLANNPIYR